VLPRAMKVAGPSEDLGANSPLRRHQKADTLQGMSTLSEVPASYKKLLRRAREIALASSASSALSWDQET